MTIGIWIGTAILSLGLIAWAIYWIREQLRWAEIRKLVGQAHAASEEIAKIASSSSDPLSALAVEIKSTDEFRRAAAAEYIANIGTREAAEVLCLALEDSDIFVRREARKAVRYSKSATEEFKKIVFDSVALGLKEADSDWATPEGNYQGDGCEDVIALLPKLDHARAAIELTKPDTLRVNHPNSYDLIQRLTWMRVPLDNSVFDWLAVLRPCVAEGRKNVTGRSAMVYGELLKAAAFKKHPQTATWIDDLFQHRENVVEWSALEGASEAKAILAGLSLTLREDLECRVESHGFESLSKPEQHFVAVMNMHMLTELYGIGDYVFSTTMGEVALEGLVAMNEHYVRPRLQRALELRDQQKEIRDEARKQALIETIDCMEWPQDVKYQSVTMLAYLYAATNADAFKDKA